MPRKNKIVIRTGSTAPSAADFVTSEPAWDSSAGKLYIKSAAGTMVEIGAGGGGTTELVYTAATTADLPATGDASKLYVTTDHNRIWRWVDSTTKYCELGPIGGGDTTFWNLFLPPAPTNVAGTTADTQSVVSWTAPTVSAQTPITDYLVQTSSDGGSTWTTFSDGTSAATSATVTGLTNGTTYKFRVAAVNAVGTGSYSSASANVTPAVGDGYFSSVQALLHLDGNNNSTTFTDSSSSPKTFTASGSAVISTTQSKFGGASLYPNGGYITAAYNSAFNMGTGDLAVDGWVYPTSSTGIYGIYAISSGSGANPKFVVHLDNLTPKIHYNNLTNGSDIYTSATSACTVNAWNYIAFSRASGTWRWYVNGTLAGSGSNNTTLTFSSSPSYVGYGGESYFGSFAGYIDDWRVTVGSARGFTGSTVSTPTVAFPNS